MSSFCASHICGSLVRWGGAHVTFCLLASASAWSPATARAAEVSASEKFAVVERLLDRADFEGAEEADLRLLASGALSRREVAKAHLELGIIHGARGTAEAELEFLRALLLDSQAELPATVGPEVAEAFARARKRFETEPSLSVRVQIVRPDGAKEVIVQSFIQGVRVGLVERLEVQGHGLRQHFELDDSEPSASYRLPAVGLPCTPLSVRVSDRYGNELWRFEEGPEVCEGRRTPVTLDAKTPPHERDVVSKPARRSLPAQVYIGALVSANLMIATGVIGIAALNARADYHRILHNPQIGLTQKQSEHDHASRLQDLATAAGIGAVTGIGATALLYFAQQNRAPRGRSASPSVLLDVGPDRAEARVRLEF